MDIGTNTGKSKPGLRTATIRRLRMVVVSMLAVVLTGDGVTRADDWPQWRGPQRNAISAETGLLRSWPDGGPKVAWKAAGLGAGYASVVVHRGRVFMIGKQGSDVVVTALETATGKALWNRKIGATARMPCATPTVDDDRLYALSPDGDLVCLKSATGDFVWQRSFVKDFGGRMQSGRGYGESPLVDGDRLICTPGGAGAALVALDKNTGATIWKTQMPDIGPKGRDGAGFSSIVATKAVGRRQFVQLMGRGVIGVDAQNGRFLWGYNAIANSTANIPTPLVRDDLVFAANGYDAGSVLLRLLPESKPGPATSGVKAETVYTLTGTKFQNHHGGVVLVGNHLYGGHGNNNGLPTCVELETGRVAWKQRGPGEGSAAVVYAEGHLYFRYQNGVVALIEANPDGYHLKGTLQIPGAGGDSWAHPVVANGRLYLREQDLLWVHDLQRPTTTLPTDPASPLPVLDPALTALQKLDVIVQPLSAIRSEKARRLYRYAAGPDTTTPPVLVVLADKHLTAQGTVSPALLDALRKTRMPFILSLAGTHMRDAGLDQLRDLDPIVGINLELCGELTDAGLTRLPSLKNLQILILTGTNITKAGLQHLVRNKSLVALDLEVCDGISDAACESIGGLRQLKALVLKKTGFEPRMITDAGVKHLGNLPDLEALNLYGNLLTDAGLDHLKGLTKLRELNLSLLAITDRGLAHLKPLGNLERLDLLYSQGFAGPTITNSGLESLGQLTNLSVLNLTGARITDKGLERLQGLKKLKSLHVVNTGISAAGVKTFQAARPDCEISR